MGNTDKERITALETSSSYHKDDLNTIIHKLDTIEQLIESLNSFKFQLIGISSAFAIIISLASSLLIK